MTMKVQEESIKHLQECLADVEAKVAEAARVLKQQQEIILVCIILLQKNDFILSDIDLPCLIKYMMLGLFIYHLIFFCYHLFLRFQRKCMIFGLFSIRSYYISC